MKKSTSPLALFALLALLCWACANNPQDNPPVVEAETDTLTSQETPPPATIGRMADDGTEIIYNVSEDKNLHDMAKEKFLPELKQYSRKDIFSGSGPDSIEIAPVLFQPNEYAGNYLYTQVLFYKGESVKDDFALFYPDDKGQLSGENYVHIPEDERPCKGCDFAGIRRPTGKDPYGLFIDRKTTAIMEYDMDYNLAEGLIQWVKREY